MIDIHNTWYVDASDDYCHFVKGTKQEVTDFLKEIMAQEMRALDGRADSYTAPDDLVVQDGGDKLTIFAEFLPSKEHPEGVQKLCYTAKRLSSIPIHDLGKK